ncbi:hypothetical protein B6D52_02055 [Candidatus Parcubacteria bacterium 4484_255]|nr:MAG: hypothetical protein B6D52_02055 [Candidatus Parcubacteria bacterium 4484_255]
MKKNILENLNTEKKAETDYSPEEQVVKKKIENKAKGYYLMNKAIQLAENISNERHQSEAIAGIAQSEVECGSIDKAIQLAENIRNEYYQTEVIAGIAQSEAGYEKIDKLIQFAEDISDESYKTGVIIQIAEQIEIGNEKIDKLIRLTGNISDESCKVTAIAGIAQTKAGYEKIDKLIQLAEDISDEPYKSSVMTEIARAEAKHGNIDKAIHIAEDISDEIFEPRAIAGIAQAEAEHGNINKAIQFVKDISHENHKAKAIADIAQTEVGYENIDKLIELTEGINDENHKAKAIAGVALAEAKHGNIDKAIQFAKDINDGGYKARAIVGIAQTEVGYENIDKLMQLAKDINDGGYKARAIVGIAQTEAGYKKIDKLVQLAEGITSIENYKFQIIAKIAQIEAEHENIDKAIRLTENIKDDENYESRAIVGIAKTEVGYENIDKLIQLTESINDENHKAEAMIGVAQAVAKHGDIDRALQLTENISDECDKSKALAGIACAQAKHAGKLISENNIELSSEDLKKIFLKSVDKKDKKLIKAIGVIANDEDFKELSNESEQDIKDLLLSDRIKVSTFKDKNILKSITDSYIQRLIETTEIPQNNKQQIKFLSEILRDLRNNQYKDEQSIKDVLKQIATELPADSKHLPRLLKTLCEIKDDNSYYLAFRLSAKKKIPQKIFSYVIKKLESKQYLPKETLKYLKPENIDSLKRLINEYPNQFANTIDVISNIKDYGLKENEQEIFSALNDLKTLTPIIFNRYRNSKGVERTKLVSKINKLKSQFFRNKPIKNILKKEDEEIIDEMTYISYKPIGMGFERVKELISKIEDRTDDLKEYSFPENGYDFDLSKDQVYILKTNESIDFKRINELKNLFNKEYPKNDKDIEGIRNCLLKIAKAGTDLNNEEISSILSIVCDDENIKVFKKNYRNIGKSNTYHFLNELYENIGIYFKDSYTNYLHNFLNENTKIFNQIKNILKQEKRQNVIKQKMGKEQSKDIGLKDFENDEGIVSILSTFISSKILQKIRIDIKKEIKKFERTTGDKNKTEYRKKAKAYISKNVGSFFAKASAGICTAEDINLFNRKDHFHINIVEEEQFVRANIQAYIVEIGRKKSLLLRGINPNTDFLKNIDIESFCEKVFEIAKKFGKDNKLKNVYITEQGGWHALSNRQQIYNFLKKYLKKKNEKRFKFDVSKNQTIHRIYKIEQI